MHRTSPLLFATGVNVVLIAGVTVGTLVVVVAIVAASWAFIKGRAGGGEGKTPGTSAETGQGLEMENI